MISSGRAAIPSTLLCVALIGSLACGSGEQAAPEPAADVAKKAAAPEPVKESTAKKEAPRAPAAPLKFAKIDESAVDPAQRATAERFAREYITRCQAGKFEPLGDEANARMRQMFTPETQRRAHGMITEMMGEFLSMEYVEAQRTLSGHPDTIFRFRGSYSKDTRPEIRVVLDGAGKVGGFWIRPWRDSLGPPKPVKIAETDVDQERKKKAMELADAILKRQREGRFEPLGEEASPAMRAGLTPERQRKAHEAQKGQLGDYQSLEYVETWNVAADGFHIYRLRGSYSTPASPEIRVVIDREGRLSGLWLKPWKDEMN